MQSYQIAFILLLATAVAMSTFYRARAGYMRDPSVTREAEGKVLLAIRVIGGLVLWAGFLGYGINPNWFSWAALDLPAALRWTGAGLAALTLPLFRWVFVSIGPNITDTVATRTEHTLVTVGPYRWIRHPLYSFGCLYITGLSLLASNWLLPSGFVLLFMVILRRTKIEEAQLIARFGEEYRRYMARTGGFLPRVARRAR